VPLLGGPYVEILFLTVTGIRIDSIYIYIHTYYNIYNSGIMAFPSPSRDAKFHIGPSSTAGPVHRFLGSSCFDSGALWPYDLIWLPSWRCFMIPWHHQWLMDCTQLRPYSIHVYIARYSTSHCQKDPRLVSLISSVSHPMDELLLICGYGSNPCCCSRQNTW